jgi:hypothetical protein
VRGDEHQKRLHFFPIFHIFLKVIGGVSLFSSALCVILATFNRFISWVRLTGLDIRRDIFILVSNMHDSCSRTRFGNVERYLSSLVGPLPGTMLPSCAVCDGINEVPTSLNNFQVVSIRVDETE